MCLENYFWKLKDFNIYLILCKLYFFLIYIDVLGYDF